MLHSKEDHEKHSDIVDVVSKKEIRLHYHDFHPCRDCGYHVNRNNFQKILNRPEKIKVLHILWEDLCSFCDENQKTDDQNMIYRVAKLLSAPSCTNIKKLSIKLTSPINVIRQKLLSKIFQHVKHSLEEMEIDCQNKDLVNLIKIDTFPRLSSLQVFDNGNGFDFNLMPRSLTKLGLGYSKNKLCFTATAWEALQQFNILHDLSLINLDVQDPKATESQKTTFYKTLSSVSILNIGSCNWCENSSMVLFSAIQNSKNLEFLKIGEVCDTLPFFYSLQKALKTRNGVCDLFGVEITTSSAKSLDPWLNHFLFLRRLEITWFQHSLEEFKISHFLAKPRICVNLETLIFNVDAQSFLTYSNVDYDDDDTDDNDKEVVLEDWYNVFEIVQYGLKISSGALREMYIFCFKDCITRQKNHNDLHFGSVLKQIQNPEQEILKSIVTKPNLLGIFLDAGWNQQVESPTELTGFSKFEMPRVLDAMGCLSIVSESKNRNHRNSWMVLSPLLAFIRLFPNDHKCLGLYYEIQIMLSILSYCDHVDPNTPNQRVCRATDERTGNELPLWRIRFCIAKFLQTRFARSIFSKSLFDPDSPLKSGMALRPMDPNLNTILCFMQTQTNKLSVVNK